MTDEPDERLSASKDEKHGTVPPPRPFAPNSRDRLAPVSKPSPGSQEVLPDLSKKVHGGGHVRGVVLAAGLIGGSGDGAVDAREEGPIEEAGSPVCSGPAVDLDVRDIRAALGEVALDEEVTDLVLAVERRRRDVIHGVLEDPERDLCVAGAVEPVGTEVDDLVARTGASRVSRWDTGRTIQGAVVRVLGGICVLKVRLVRAGWPTLVPPLADVVDVLRPALGEDPIGRPVPSVTKLAAVAVLPAFGRVPVPSPTTVAQSSPPKPAGWPESSAVLPSSSKRSRS